MPDATAATASNRPRAIQKSSDPWLTAEIGIGE
jgi:hypothetical protein